MMVLAVAGLFLLLLVVCGALQAIVRRMGRDAVDQAEE